MKTIKYKLGTYTGEVNAAGQPHGKGFYWDEYYEKKYEGRFKNGEMDGIFLVYNSKGVLVGSPRYSNGIKK